MSMELQHLHRHKLKTYKNIYMNWGIGRNNTKLQVEFGSN